MKKALITLLVLTLMAGVGFLIYTYTPNVAHQKFDARMNIQNMQSDEESGLFINEIKEELEQEETE